jgi:hypothetical protein
MAGRIRLLISVGLVAWGLGLAGPGGAVMIPLTIDDLTSQAETVLTGKVTEVESTWSQDGKVIITQAKVQVDLLLKGQAPGATVVVEYLGGEVGGLGFRVSDSPSLAAGEEVVLFLKPVESLAAVKPSAETAADGSGQPLVQGVVGQAQGKYSVTSEGLATKGGFSVVGDINLTESNLPLTDLIAKIRQVSHD